VPTVGYPSAPFDAMRARLANELGRPVLEDPCGHDAMAEERACWITMDRFYRGKVVLALRSGEVP
jgi:hypothetical protein